MNMLNGLLPFVAVSFANEKSNTIVEALTSALKELYQAITSIALPIGVVIIAICGLYLLFGSNPKYIEKAKSWALAIFIGLLVVFGAPKIVSWLSEIVSDGTFTTTGW